MRSGRDRSRASTSEAPLISSPATCKGTVSGGRARQLETTASIHSRLAGTDQSVSGSLEKVSCPCSSLSSREVWPPHPPPPPGGGGGTKIYGPALAKGPRSAGGGLWWW